MLLSPSLATRIGSMKKTTEAAEQTFLVYLQTFQLYNLNTTLISA